MTNDQTELTVYNVSDSNNNDDSNRLIIKSLSSASASAPDKAFEKPKIMIMNNETKMQNYSKISRCKNNNTTSNRNNANDDNIDSVVNDINNACAISNLVDRVCEESVGSCSDVSALTDVFSIKNGGDNNEFVTSISSQSLSSLPYSTSKKNCIKNSSTSSTFKSVVCAPEPPMIGGNNNHLEHLVSLKLTDIQSETTPTTISNDRDENNSLLCNKNNKKKRSVSFCEVQVRNYDRVLTVNPSVTSGPAVGLGWNYDEDEDQHYTIQNFEDSRELTRRCSMKELALPRSYREELVRSLGYTQREIASSTRQIIRVKNQRKQTIQNLHASSMEEFIEKATRKVKRVFSLPHVAACSSSSSSSSSIVHNKNKENNKRSNKKTKQHSSSTKNHRDSLSGSFLSALKKTSSLDQSHRVSVIVALE